jgi:hypothetical protein
LWCSLEAVRIFSGSFGSDELEAALVNGPRKKVGDLSGVEDPSLLTAQQRLWH